MSKRKPDNREQKRIDKHNRAEESRRAKVIHCLCDGMSLREAGNAVGRCHEYARYWREKALEITGYRYKGKVRSAVYVLRKGWRDLIKVKKTGPPKGRPVKRQLFTDRVKELKTEYPMMGCVKLKVVGGLEISGPTVCGILKEAGMIAKKKEVKRADKRFRADRPNDLWQIDYVDLGDGCHLLSVMDDCSGMIMSTDIRKTMTADDVLDIMQRCFRTYGKPKKILSDHGSQWYATCGGYSRFDEMCRRGGIEHIMGRVAHPQTQGKVERWHRTLTEETPIRVTDGLENKSKIMKVYAEFYNFIRPHWGIDLKTPGSVYRSTD